MGLASLLMPLVVPEVVRQVVPGRCRYGKALVDDDGEHIWQWRA